jgi:hypothetical protein
MYHIFALYENFYSLSLNAVINEHRCANILPAFNGTLSRPAMLRIRLNDDVNNCFTISSGNNILWPASNHTQ